MKDILIDIRKQSSYFRREFDDADTVSLDIIMTVLDEYIYDKNKNQDIKDEIGEPDPYDLYMDNKLESEV